MQSYIGGPIPTSARFSRSFLGLSRKRDPISVGRPLPEFQDMFPDFSEERILVEAQAATAKGSPYVR
jgi:hypothetical protein